MYIPKSSTRVLEFALLRILLSTNLRSSNALRTNVCNLQFFSVDLYYYVFLSSSFNVGTTKENSKDMLDTSLSLYRRLRSTIS